MPDCGARKRLDWAEVQLERPNQQEREAIWKIQIAKYQRNPKGFDIVQQSKATEGLTRSEIEAEWPTKNNSSHRPLCDISAEVGYIVGGAHNEDRSRFLLH